MQDLIYLTQSASKKLKSKKDILNIDCHKKKIYIYIYIYSR